MMIRQGKSIRLPVSIHTYSCLGHTGAHSALLILFMETLSRSTWGAKYQSAFLSAFNHTKATIQRLKLDL